MKTMLSLTVVTLLIFLAKPVVAGCGCEQVCKDQNWKWGKCGDGDTCICTNGPPGMICLTHDVLL